MFLAIFIRNRNLIGIYEIKKKRTTLYSETPGAHVPRTLDNYLKFFNELINCFQYGKFEIFDSCSGGFKMEETFFDYYTCIKVGLKPFNWQMM